MSNDQVQPSSEQPIVPAPSTDTVPATIPPTAPPSSPPQIVLSSEQQDALGNVTAFMDTDKQEFRLGGYAGTGKTTVIKEILKVLGKNYSIVVSAFTGKACFVLRKKGVRAQTLHSLLYTFAITKNGIVWHRRSRLEADPDLIIVDEASMISSQLYNDLRAHGTKLLFVGDPGQLEPVGDNPNLMAYNDFTLETIHRQALESPIIAYAHHIRNGGYPGQPPKVDLEQLLITDKRFSGNKLTAPNQVICAVNKTRRDLNAKFRISFQRSHSSLTTGEKIIVLKNNPAYGLFNGMLLFITEISEDCGNHWLCTADDEVGGHYSDLRIWKDPFLREVKKNEELSIPKHEKNPLLYCDYGYVITCHKSQGSEWDHVLVIDEWMPPKVWDMKRWRYTAITRAAKKLTYCL